MIIPSVLSSVNKLPSAAFPPRDPVMLGAVPPVSADAAVDHWALPAASTQRNTLLVASSPSIKRRAYLAPVLLATATCSPILVDVLLLVTDTAIAKVSVVAPTRAFCTCIVVSLAERLLLILNMVDAIMVPLPMPKLPAPLARKKIVGCHAVPSEYKVLNVLPAGVGSGLVTPNGLPTVPAPVNVALVVIDADAVGVCHVPPPVVPLVHVQTLPTARFGSFSCSSPALATDSTTLPVLAAVAVAVMP